MRIEIAIILIQLMTFSYTNNSSCQVSDFCNPTIKIAWTDIPPYIYRNEDQEIQGVFKIVIESFMKHCCGECVQFSYFSTMRNFGTLNKAVEGNISDIIVPLHGDTRARKYKNRPYYPVFVSPGFIFVEGLIDNSEETAYAVINSAGSAWPVLLLLVIMAIISGIIMWALDSYWNPGEFPPSFFIGSWEGFWWAFVTMTTVGFGDKAPRSFLARVYALVWVLIGLVIISLFTASVSSALTAFSLSNDVKLNGRKIITLQQSEADRYGTKKNAEIKTVSSFDEFAQRVKTKKGKQDLDVDGGLIDSYTAGFYKNILTTENGIQFGGFIEHQTGFGFVLTNKLNNKQMSRCVDHQVSAHDFWITEMMQTMEGLPEPGRSAAEEKSSSLFDYRSAIYQSVIYWCVGLIIFFVLAGLVWEFLYVRPRLKIKIGATETTIFDKAKSFDDLITKQCNELESDMMNEVKGFLESFHNNLTEIHSSKSLENIDKELDTKNTVIS